MVEQIRKPLTAEQKAKRAAYAKEWREKNPERVKEHARRSREKNKDKIRDRQKKWAEENKEHIIVKSKAYYAQNRDAQADQTLRRMFKLSLAQYEEMLASQGGGCAICGADTSLKGGAAVRFSVDHDRLCCPGDTSCGLCVRGLLCNHCNLGIGHLRDSTDLLESAISYLTHHHADAAQLEIEEPRPQ